MTKFFNTLTPSLILLLFLAVIAVPAPAIADAITYGLNGVTLADDSPVTGWFVYNPSTDSITNWSVTLDPTDPGLTALEPPASYPFTFAPGDRQIAGYDNTTPFMNPFINFIYQPTGPEGTAAAWYTLVLTLPMDSDLATPGSYQVMTSPTHASTFNVETGTIRVDGSLEVDEYITIDVQSGSLAAVPLPSTACLFGFGFIPLAWFRRRKQLGK